MNLERVDRLTAPPAVGQFYLVPTIRYEWYSKIRPWPVVGAIHNDADRFSFASDHYHLDLRFTPEWALYMRPFATPHRKFSLGSIEPINGVITCPLHGMQIDAATGRALAPNQTGGK